jgi:hypothetical protein
MLKNIILANSKTMSKSELFTILIYDNLLNSTRDCIQMVVTISVVIENVCMSSRHWKAEQVAYGTRKQPRLGSLV